MTANDFRKLALSFPEAIESAHMHHPDFRVRGKIFATLGYPDKDSGVVKFNPGRTKRIRPKRSECFPTGEGRLGTSRGYKREPTDGEDRQGARSFQRRLA